MKNVRLQKFIAASSTISRRKAEDLIAAGHVMVNGKIVTKMGTTVDPAKDVVEIDGAVVQPVTTFRYVALNKPVGLICTRAVYKNEKTVYELVPNSRDLVIAGRLDKDSGGLILMTNDGDLTNKLTHPRYEHQKEYDVTTRKPMADETLQQLQRGVRLEEGMAKLDSITSVGEKTYRLVLHQGWKRQIRRMIAQVHHDVASLTRIRINKLELAGLNPGAWREVKKSDIV